MYHISFYGNIFLFFDGGVVACAMGTMTQWPVLAWGGSIKHYLFSFCVLYIAYVRHHNTTEILVYAGFRKDAGRFDLCHCCGRGGGYCRGIKHHLARLLRCGRPT